MPAGAVYVGRPGAFGNPFGGEPNESYRAYREWLLSGLAGIPCVTGHAYGAIDALSGYSHRSEVIRRLPELRGKDLACYCPLLNEKGYRFPCHADVLLELANRQEEDSREAYPTAG